MKLNSLHILLTYQCNYTCPHCFVWGSPDQTGTFSRRDLEDVFQQAQAVGSIDSFWFEGGEAFLFYPVLLGAVRSARAHGFETGVVTNGYWAANVDDAMVWLAPLANAGLNEMFISVDALHGSATGVDTHPGLVAARRLGLSADAIVTEAKSDVRHCGRAAEALTTDRQRQPWASFDSCPFENLTDPGRVHLDPFGNLHLCQGIVIGNLFERPLRHILAEFQPETHPIVGPLIVGGPAALAQHHATVPDAGYVDACHLCDSTRHALRAQFPTVLAPDQMYGVVPAG